LGLIAAGAVGYFLTRALFPLPRREREEID
jgi:hypothetical protein